MKMKKLVSRILAVTLSIVLVASVVACGEKSTDNANTTTANGENKVDKSEITTAEEFLITQRPNDFSGTGFVSVLDTQWVDDPLFTDIIQVSGLAGLPTYQGSASDAFSVVKASLPNDWAEYNINTDTYVAFNAEGQIVLAWLEAKQDVSQETRMEVPEGASVSQDDVIRAILPVSTDINMVALRLNEVRSANALSGIAFESQNSSGGDVVADNSPTQNSASGDPNNMTAEEQTQYAQAQEDNALSEESAEATE